MSWNRDREASSVLFPSKRPGDSFGTPFLSWPAIEWMAFVSKRQRFVLAVFKAYLSNICFDPWGPKGAVAREIELPWVFYVKTSSLPIHFRSACNSILFANSPFLLHKKRSGETAGIYSTKPSSQRARHQQCFTEIALNCAPEEIVDKILTIRENDVV